MTLEKYVKSLAVLVIAFWLAAIGAVVSIAAHFIHKAW